MFRVHSQARIPAARHIPAGIAFLPNPGSVGSKDMDFLAAL